MNSNVQCGSWIYVLVSPNLSVASGLQLSCVQSADMSTQAHVSLQSPPLEVPNPSPPGRTHPPPLPPTLYLLLSSSKES